MLRSKFKFLRHLKTGWGSDVSERQGRFFAYLHTLLIDHGILRLMWKNFSQIDQNLYRANQPLPQNLAHYKKKYGIETVINLRGETAFGYFCLEKRACKKLSIELISIPFRARGAPTHASLTKLIETLSALKGPTLIHCKSGADRTGIAAVIYFITQKNIPFDEAYKQMSWRYGHLKSSKTGIMDLLFKSWQKACNENVVSFERWVKDSYDPHILTNNFNAQRQSKV